MKLSLKAYHKHKREILLVGWINGPFSIGLGFMVIGGFYPVASFSCGFLGNILFGKCGAEGVKLSMFFSKLWLRFISTVACQELGYIWT